MLLKRILTWLILACVLIAAYVVLRTRILWLDSFVGTIQEKTEDTIATVETKQTRSLSIYFLQIETDDGRELTVPVEQLQYFQSKPGMRVEKKPFSSSIQLVE